MSFVFFLAEFVMMGSRDRFTYARTVVSGRAQRHPTGKSNSGLANLSKGANALAAYRVNNRAELLDPQA